MEGEREIRGVVFKKIGFEYSYSRFVTFISIGWRPKTGLKDIPSEYLQDFFFTTDFEIPIQYFLFFGTPSRILYFQAFAIVHRRSKKLNLVI